MIDMKKLKAAVASARRQSAFAVGMFAHADQELKEANLVLSEAVKNYDKMVKEMMAEAGLLRENISDNERVRQKIREVYLGGEEPAMCDGNAPKIPHPEE